MVNTNQMTYLVYSNDMNMAKKSEYNSGKKKGSKEGDRNIDFREPEVAYEVSDTAVTNIKSFQITRAGRQKKYEIRTGYGYFIPSLKNASNLVQVSELVEKGIPSNEISSIVHFLDFRVSEIAKATSVSPSTVSRWEPDTAIGAPGSHQFFKIDQLIRKGVDLFGGLEEFRGWLQSPNMALGNSVPAKLLTSMIGLELVDEALEALQYGNVM